MAKTERFAFQAGTKANVFWRVKKVLVHTLKVDDKEVTPSAKLSADLNAESIDYLDITFQLEKAFGIKTIKSELFMENLFTNPEFIQNGKMTPKGLAELRTRMPFASDELAIFETDPDINNFRNIFTVNVLVNFVCTKLNITR